MSNAYDSSSRTTASTQYSSTPRRSSVSGFRVSPGTMPHKIMRDAPLSSPPLGRIEQTFYCLFPMPDQYCELHAHSNFSFLDGASHPEELIGRAAVLGMPSLAVTDHAGLYAAVRLWKAAAQTRTAAARDAGLSPVSAIVGLELAIPADERSLRLARRGRKLNDPLRGERASRGWPGEFHAGPMPGDHLVLLARDGPGYAALSRLASRGHLAGEKQFPVFERTQ